MSKKVINILLILALIFLGFTRSYFFFNVHYAEVFIQGKYNKSYTDSWLQWMDNFSMDQMFILRWVATVFFIMISFLITYLLLKNNFKKTKASIYLFGTLFIFAFINYMISLLEVPYTFQISRRSLHFLQSPLPAGVLFLYYKFILPLNTNRSIEQRK